MNSLRLEGQKTLSHRDRAAVRLGGAGRGHRPGRQPRQRQRDWRRVRPDDRARAHLASALGSSWRRRRRQTRSTLAYQNNWQFEPMTARADDCVGDPDRQSRVGAQGDPDAAAVQRHCRASHRERARGRGGTGGPHRHVQLPPHRRRAGRARETRRARRDRRRPTARSSFRRRTGSSSANSRSPTTPAGCLACSPATRIHRSNCPTITTQCAERWTAWSLPPRPDPRRCGAIHEAGVGRARRTPGGAGNLEVRRRLACGRGRDRARRGAHCRPSRSARDCRIGTWRRDRSAPRPARHSPRPERRTKPQRLPRSSFAAITTWRKRCCRKDRHGAPCSPASTRRRGSIAICAAQSRFSGTSRRAPATCSSPGANGCPRPFSRPRFPAPGAGRHTSMRPNGRDRRAAWERGPGAGRNRPPRAAPAAAVTHWWHHAGRARLHRCGTGRRRHHARSRRLGSDRDSARAAAGGAVRRAVEGRARHPHRRSPARARRPAHSAAAPPRGGGGRALRRQGAAPARVDSARRHANSAPRQIVPRPESARHRSLRAPLRVRLPGQGAGDRPGPGDRHRRR